jgi:hypothetical protein
LSKKLGVW